jgi:plastocyanin
MPRCRSHPSTASGPGARATGTRLFAVLGVGGAIGAAGCAPAPSSAARYTPQTRAIAITTVPLLVRETQSLYPFLQADFAPGGVLDGKEVYAFSPSTLTVVEGDTIAFTFVNPEDDEHSFVLPDFAVAIPGQQVTHATYVARHAGIYRFECSIPSHLPMMAGQLVVLAPGAVTGGGGTEGGPATARR